NDRKLAQLQSLHAQAARADADAGNFSEIQSRADEALSRHGRRAGAPMLGDTPLNYRKVLATQVAAFSPKWAALPLASVNDTAFERLESEIFADAASAPI